LFAFSCTMRAQAADNVAKINRLRALSFMPMKFKLHGNHNK